MKITEKTETILELRSQKLTHYDADGSPVYTSPKHEAFGTHKQLLAKQAELRRIAIEEGEVDKVVIWITPLCKKEAEL